MQDLIKTELELILGSKVIIQDNVVKTSVKLLNAKQIAAISDVVLEHDEVKELEVKRSGTKVTVLVYLK